MHSAANLRAASKSMSPLRTRARDLAAVSSAFSASDMLGTAPRPSRSSGTKHRPALRRRPGIIRPASVPQICTGNFSASGPSPEIAWSSSCCPLPETPAMPTISPECTSRCMSLRSVPNGSSDACESPSQAQPDFAALLRLAVLAHGQVLADHEPRHRLRRLLRGHAVAGHLAPAQHRRRMAELLDLVELVADVEDAATLRGQLAQGLEELAHRLGREHRRRLVHDQELRVLQQAADDLDPLPLADRQRMDEPARIGGQAVLFRDLLDAPREIAEIRRARQRQRDILDDGQRLEQREVLEDHPDAERARVGGIGRRHRLRLPRTSRPRSAASRRR